MYGLILSIGMCVAKLLALFDKKTAKFFSLRKGEIDRVAEYFSKKKSRKNKVIWFHAASAGEFEQAKPLIEKFYETLKDAQIIASFFSPSGYEAGLKYSQIDFCFNLPFDFKRNVKRLLDCVRPHIIIYCKYDVWTNLTIEAHKRGVKLALISATLPAKSLRHRFPFRIFFARAYSALDKIYAISEADAVRYKKISKSNPSSILVAGDTRFERVKDVIINKRSKAKKIFKKEKGWFYLVAGSTYKVSEEKLIRTKKKLRANGAHVKLVLVPHEINDDNIQRVKALINSHGFTPICYSNATLPVSIKHNEILIVDVFGVLALLYKEADIVFVGGSFKGSIHSVLEPAVFGKPILTGPYIGNAYEAIKLKESGGLIVCKNKNEVYQGISRLLRDENYRLKISQTAKNFFENNAGAAKIILKDMKSFLS